MTASALEEIVGELYRVPPSEFVAVRNDLIRQARAAGDRELTQQLQSLRRPTRSAWLVNQLAHHDSAALKRLAALGRELRDAQTGLDGAQLRQLSEERRQLIGHLLDRARDRAAEAGLRLTDGVRSEIEGTLHAALADLAGSFTVRTGRLARPLSHNGFGPRPHVSYAPTAPSTAELTHEVEAEPIRQPVADELAARRERALASRIAAERTDRARLADERAEAERALRRAEAELSAAESAHQQREDELAEAKAILEAASDRLSWLDSQQREARRDKASAQEQLTRARSQERDAVRAIADAQRRLDMARRQMSRF